MIFVDSNIPIYLVGAEHPHKTRATRLLDDLIVDEERLVTDVEVYQEILHRYAAIRRVDAIQPAFDALTGIIDETFPIENSVVEAAKDIVLGEYGISARDAVHAAVMHARGITCILSFDTGFDRYPRVERIG